MFQWLVVAAVIAAVTSEPAADHAAETISIHDVYSDHYDDRSGMRDRGGMKDYGIKNLGGRREMGDLKDYGGMRGMGDLKDYGGMRGMGDLKDYGGMRGMGDLKDYDGMMGMGGMKNHDGYDDRDNKRDGEHNGPNIVRLVDPGNIVHGPHNAREKEIILNAYSPDYYEPTWILDYRYLKTGGRDYTRSDGGQIMILPKNVYSNEKKEHKNFDELLEFLRLKQLSEAEAHRLHGEKKYREYGREERMRRPESYASTERNKGYGDEHGYQMGGMDYAGLKSNH